MSAEGEDIAPATYEIEVCEPPTRLAVRAVDEAGVWRLSADLHHEDGVTTLVFAQVIEDPSTIASTGPGWDWYLDRLVAAETGADPAALDWDRDYHLALEDHYLAIQKQVTGG